MVPHPMPSLGDDVEITTGRQTYDGVAIGPDPPRGTRNILDDHRAEVTADLVAQERADAWVLTPFVDLAVEDAQTVGPVV